MKEIQFDEEDFILLEKLQAGRKSLKEISKEVGMPMSTVHEKIKRFEKAGIVKDYRTILDAKRLGFDVTAFILATTKYLGGEKTFQRRIGDQVATLPNVLETHSINGDWDLMIKVKFKNVHELGRFVDERIRTIPGIDRTLTVVSIDEIKEDTVLRLR